MPRVSVVITTYNRGNLVGDAIRSVLGQSFGDLEVIVVDDGSTDDTRTVVERFGKSITYVYQDNAERAAARNRGLAIASGEFVAFLDSDDMLFPRALELELAAFAAHPGAGLVYGKIVLMRPDGTLLGLMRRRAYEGEVLHHIARTNFVGVGSSLVRRSLFESVGAFTEDRGLSGSEDWEAWVRLAAVTAFAYVPHPVLRYRVHAGSTVGNPASMERSLMRASDLIFSNPSLIPRIGAQQASTRAHLHVTMSHLYRAAGDSPAAWRHLTRAFRQYPYVAAKMSYWAAAARLVAGQPLVSRAAKLKRWIAQQSGEANLIS